MRLFRKDTWEPYIGPQGGEGWRNTETDEIEYGEEPPGETEFEFIDDDFSPDDIEVGNQYGFLDMADNVITGEVIRFEGDNAVVRDEQGVDNEIPVDMFAEEVVAVNEVADTYDVDDLNELVGETPELDQVSVGQKLEMDGEGVVTVTGTRYDKYIEYEADDGSTGWVDPDFFEFTEFREELNEDNVDVGDELLTPNGFTVTAEEVTDKAIFAENGINYKFHQLEDPAKPDAEPSEFEYAIDINQDYNPREGDRLYNPEKDRHVEVIAEPEEGEMLIRTDEGTFMPSNLELSDAVMEREIEQLTTQMNKYEFESGGFDEQVAEHVVKGDVVGTIRSYEWNRNYTSLDDDTLALDALRQVLEDGGTATAESKLRSRLRGMGYSTDEINQAVSAGPGPDEGEDPYEVLSGIDQAERRLDPERQETARTLVNDVSTEALDDFIDANSEYGEKDSAQVRMAKAAAYYRSNSETVESGRHIINEMGTGDTMSHIRDDMSAGIDDFMRALPEEKAVAMMSNLDEVEWQSMEASGSYDNSKRKINMSQFQRGAQDTMIHELGHHLHNQMGLSTESGTYEDWDPDKSRGEYDYGIQTHVSTDDETHRTTINMEEQLRKTQKNWDRFQQGDATPLRSYQKRHGVEYMAVTFRHWCKDKLKLQRADPHQALFWDEFAGDREVIREPEIENLGVGDDAVVERPDGSTLYAEIQSVEDDDGDVWVDFYSLDGTGEEFTAKEDEALEMIQGVSKYE